VIPAIGAETGANAAGAAAPVTDGHRPSGTDTLESLWDRRRDVRDGTTASARASRAMGTASSINHC